MTDSVDRYALRLSSLETLDELREEIMQLWAWRKFDFLEFGRDMSLIRSRPEFRRFGRFARVAFSIPVPESYVSKCMAAHDFFVTERGCDPDRLRAVGLAALWDILPLCSDAEATEAWLRLAESVDQRARRRAIGASTKGFPQGYAHSRFAEMPHMAMMAGGRQGKQRNKMADEITRSVIDDYKEHETHDEPVESCSECYKAEALKVTETQ